MAGRAEIQRNLRKLEGNHPGTMQEHTRRFRIIKNAETKGRYYRLGFTHKQVFAGGTFLYLHKSNVAKVRDTLHKMSKRG